MGIESIEIDEKGSIDDMDNDEIKLLIKFEPETTTPAAVPMKTCILKNKIQDIDKTIKNANDERDNLIDMLNVINDSGVIEVSDIPEKTLSIVQVK